MSKWDSQSGQKPGGHDRPMPKGNRIATALRKLLRKQRNEVLGVVGKAYDCISQKANGQLKKKPKWFDKLKWDKEMKEKAKPGVQFYYKKGGEDAVGRLGFGSEFDLSPPKVQSSIEKTSFNLSKATNATTRLQLDVAHAQLREQLVAGLIGPENIIPAMTKRIQEIYIHADKFRAGRIARTESSRAIHRGQRLAAKQTGIVKGFRVLLSSDPCPLCIEIAQRHADGIGLDETFGKASQYSKGPATAHPLYDELDVTPFHPYCQCTMTEIIDKTALKPSKSVTLPNSPSGVVILNERDFRRMTSKVNSRRVGWSNQATACRCIH